MHHQVLLHLIEMHDNIKKLEEENEKLKKENEELKEENEEIKKLKEENKKLKEENEEIKKLKEEYIYQNKILKEENRNMEKYVERKGECWNCDKALFDADEDWGGYGGGDPICNDCWDELSCVECEERYKEEDCDGMLVMCHECQAEAEAEVKARDNK